MAGETLKVRVAALERMTVLLINAHGIMSGDHGGIFDTLRLSLDAGVIAGSPLDRQVENQAHALVDEAERLYRASR